MLAIFNIVLPVFALVGAGYVMRWKNYFSDMTCAQLNRYVVYLALPALMIDVMAGLKFEDLCQTEFLVVSEASVFIVFFAVLAFHWYFTKNLSSATIDATCASYSNAGYIGIPLAILAFGSENLSSTIIAAVLAPSVNLAFSIVLLEYTAENRSGSVLKTLGRTCINLAKNPLILGPFIGFLICVSGWTMPESVSTGIHLLGASAPPVALVATGIFLAERNDDAPLFLTFEISAIKLLIQPAIVWVMVTYMIDMPKLWADSAILTAAMPVGTGPFMLAEMYGRGRAVSAKTIFMTTALGVLSVSFWLAVIR